MMLDLFSRRCALAMLGAAAASPVLSRSSLRGLATGERRFAIAARSPWLCNAVAVTAQGEKFLGLPRFAGHLRTPSLVKVGSDGALAAFPGGDWNNWKPGDVGREAFVMVNAIHIFADGSLWVVDQGSVDHDPTPAAAKLVRLDPTTGRVLTVLRFGPAILPAGATMNDLRIHGSRIFVTDSGLGGIIVHDLATSRTLRRLSGHPLLRKPPEVTQRGAAGRALADRAGKRPETQSDAIELSADGAWLYWGTPTGPIRRIATVLLTNERLDDVALAGAIQTVADIPTIGGTAIDTLGNLYFSDVEHRRIAVLTPTGARRSLVEDDRLVSPDAIFIDANRRLLVPAAQIENIATNAGGVDRTRAPWLVLATQLPRRLDGVMLGDAVTGAVVD